MKKIKIISLIIAFSLILISCKNGKFPKLPGADARKVSYDSKERVRKNLEEGKGFRLMDAVSNGNQGDFSFASSNELWRASLDIIGFMPLASANYSGGILVTDWYSENQNSKDSVKISIRFLTNEIRSDSMDIKVFYRNCEDINNCKIFEKGGNLESELKSEILKKAAIYEKQRKDKDFRPYTGLKNERN